MSSKILDDMRDVMRRRHYSIRTERSYCAWVKRFVLHFNMKSRNDLTEGEKKIETYLTFLTRDRNLAPSTQNQALNALVFLYKHVLKQPLNEKINAERAATKVGRRKYLWARPEAESPSDSIRMESKLLESVFVMTHGTHPDLLPLFGQ